MTAREGWSEIECPCCGDVAAEGCWFPDGMALLCGCRGQISCDSETEPHVNVDDCDCEGRSVSERIADARAEGRREAETALRRAVNEECDCGGAEYGKGCKACDVWHKARALSAPATTGAPEKCNGRCGGAWNCPECGPEVQRVAAAARARSATTVGEGPPDYDLQAGGLGLSNEELLARYGHAAAPPSPPKGGEPTCGGYMCNFPECPKHGTGTQWNAGRPRPESAKAKVCRHCGGLRHMPMSGDDCPRCGGTGRTP